MSTRSYDIITGVETDTLPNSGTLESTLVSSKNVDYVILDTDSIGTLILIGSVSKTFTLPTVADNNNRKLTFINDSTATLTIDGEGSETINNALTLALVNTGDGVEIQSNGTEWFILGRNFDTQILAEQTIGAVGDTSQVFAGHELAVVEGCLTGDVLALYKFGATITADEQATYELTNVGSVAAAAGIFNVASTAASFNGSSQYFTQPTLFDTTPTAIGVSLWFKANDGQPSGSQWLFVKFNDITAGSLDAIFLGILSSGYLSFGVYANAASSTSITSSTQLPNGATGWYHVVCTWDTTYGTRLFVNGIQESGNSSATTLMSSGTTKDFIIGAYNYGAIADYYSGLIDEMKIFNRVLTQKDIDILYASKHTISPAFMGSNYQTWNTLRDSGSSYFISQDMPGVLHQTSSELWLYGGQYKNTTDKLAIYGRE